MKTLIKNGLVLLQDGAGWQAEEKDVLLRDSRIESIASVISGDGCRVIDAKDHLVMPGLINAHTVDQVEQGMTEEDVYWTTMLAIIEMLRSGTTCFVDMAIKSAKEKTGPNSAVAARCWRADSGQ